METEIRYYQLPIINIPFAKIASLENIEHSTIICSEFSLPDSDGKCLISVYDTFDLQPELFNAEKVNMFFGTILSESLPKRGKDKCTLISKTIKNIKIEDYPHLRYTSKVRDSPDGNWFYTKNGDYYIFKAIETEFEKAKHLESISIYGDWVIRLRIVIELLKKNIKEGKINMSIDQIKGIAFDVLKSEPSLGRLNDEEIMNGVNNWVPSMMFTPLIEDIPVNIRGKVKE
jgi:hypothetical protein